MSRVTQFLLDRGPDHKGRTLSQIYQFGDDQFDGCHDFIQWMFPLPKQSNFFAGDKCPILVEDDVYEIRYGSNRRILQANLKNNVQKFLTFLGFSLTTVWGDVGVREEYIIRAELNFSGQAKYWLKANDHNHLRINRMIQCLVMCGHEVLAKEIFRALSLIKCEFDDCITNKTMEYWRNALTGYSY